MNLNKKFISICLISTFLFNFVTIWGIAKYRALPLNNLGINKQIEQDTVSFSYKVFDNHDCKVYLGRDNFLANGYQPIEIRFTNNTDASLDFSLNSFSLSCIPYDIVLQNVNFNTTGRIVGWGMGTLFFFPFVIPLILEAIEAPKAHENMEIDLSNKALVDQVVPPHTSIRGIVFASTKKAKGRKQSQLKFSFDVEDIQNHKKYTLSTENN